MGSERTPSRPVTAALAVAIAATLGVGGAAALGALPTSGRSAVVVRAEGGPAVPPAPDLGATAGADVDVDASVGVVVGTVPPVTGPPAPTTTVPRPAPTLPLPVVALPTTLPAPPTTVPATLTAGVYTLRPDGSGLVRVSPGPSRFSWSPDGTRLAMDRGGGLVVAAADGSGERVLVPAGSDVNAPAWSPDGARIAFVRGGAGLYVTPADGSAPAALVDRDAMYPAWAPDGRLSALRPGQELVVYAADGSARVLASGVGNGVAPAWSPDGSRVAYLTDRIMVVGPDGTGGRALTSPCCANEYVGSPLAWSPDGRRLAFIDGPHVHTVPGDGGAATTVVRDAFTPSWSPDGRRLVFLYGDGRGVGAVDATGADGRPVLELPPTLWANGLAWSAAGDRLAVLVTPAGFVRAP